MQNLRFTREQIVWQEVPGEVSLAFLISGCQLHCKGCHSSDSWQAQCGTMLTKAYLQERLTQYQGLISCVLFMGGEWQANTLYSLLDLTQQAGLKTCLYTGLEEAELIQQAPLLLSKLTFLKTGRWQAELGGLDSATTNQKFIDLRTHTILNHLFLGTPK